MVKVSDRYLKISEPEIAIRVARKLSPTLALRYQALPLAEGGGLITVAMVDPTDTRAREAIRIALGIPMNVVQVDRKVIKHAISMLWPEWCSRPQRILLWAASESDAALITPYAQGVAHLMKASLDTFETEETGVKALRALAAEAELARHVLVIPGTSDRALMMKWITDPQIQKIMKRVPASMLLPQQPRLPIMRILLALRNEEACDWPAVEWAIRMALLSDANITVLPITPPVPRLFDGMASMQHNLPTLLSTDTCLGREMRRVAHHLADWDIKVTLRLRNEEPYWQICNEAEEGDYDLIIIPAEPASKLMRWLKGEVIDPILCWANRPVLVANPIGNDQPPDEYP